VVGDLENVEAREPGPKQGRIEILLRVTGQQEPAPVRLA
jgi:hypothetical protein